MEGFTMDNHYQAHQANYSKNTFMKFINMFRAFTCFLPVPFKNQTPALEEEEEEDEIIDEPKISEYIFSDMNLLCDVLPSFQEYEPILWEVNNVAKKDNLWSKGTQYTPWLQGTPNPPLSTSKVSTTGKCYASSKSTTPLSYNIIEDMKNTKPNISMYEVAKLHL